MYLSIFLSIPPFVHLSILSTYLLRKHIHIIYSIVLDTQWSVKVQGPVQPALAAKSDLPSSRSCVLAASFSSCVLQVEAELTSLPPGKLCRANPDKCKGRPAVEMPSRLCWKLLGRQPFPPLRASAAMLLPFCPTLVYGSVPQCSQTNVALQAHGSPEMHYVERPHPGFVFLLRENPLSAQLHRGAQRHEQTEYTKADCKNAIVSLWFTRPPAS